MNLSTRKLDDPRIAKLKTRLRENPGRASDYKEISRLMAARGDHRRAAGVLRRGLKTIPDDQGLLEHLARIQAKAGWKKASERTWRKLTLLYPESFLAFEKLERHYVRSGRPERAVRLYRGVRPTAALREKSLERIVFVCKETENHADALKTLKQLARSFGADFRRSRDIGRLAFKLERFREALAWFDRAADLGGLDRDQKISRATALIRLKKYRRAERELCRMLAEQPGSFAPLALLAEMKIELGDPTAGETLAELESRYPRNSRCLLARGEFEMKRGKVEMAEDLIRRGIAATAFYYRWELGRGWRLLGSILQNRGEIEEGQRCLILADSLAGAADTYTGMIELAEELVKARRFSRADWVLEKTAALFPENGRVSVNRAEILVEKGYPERAIGLLSDRLEKIPAKFWRDKKRGYLLLARAYRGLGDWETARQCARQAELAAG